MLVLAFLTAFTLHLVLFSYSPLIPLIIDEMQISHAEAGLVFSISMLAILVFRLPWGFVSDRLGVVTTMRLATVIIGVFSLVRGFATNYTFLLASQLLLGVGFASVLPCLAKIVNLMFTEKAGFATGIYVLGFPTGELVGLSITSYLLLILLGDWRLIFQIFGMWSILLAVLWWIVGSRVPVKSKHQHSLSLKEVTALLKVRQIWMLAGLCICSMGVYDTLLTWLPRLLELKGMLPTEANITASLFPIGFFVAGPVVGTLSDKVGLRKPFIWGLGFTSVIVILLIQYTTQGILYITIVLAGFALSGILTLVLVIPTEDTILSQFVGGAVGVFTTLGNIGSVFFPIIIGGLIDITHSSMPPLTVLAIMGGTSVLLNMVIRETGKRRYSLRE